jgi:hypothetical protein
MLMEVRKNGREEGGRMNWNESHLEGAKRGEVDSYRQRTAVVD